MNAKVITLDTSQFDMSFNPLCSVQGAIIVKDCQQGLIENRFKSMNNKTTNRRL